MTFGDPRYMSPEQARGDRIDRRADIYQLGCVAYEMLTNAPPFTGSRVFDILTKQVTEIPAPLPTRRPGVPLWMEAAVAKMLAKDPENRFATTTRMVEALRRGLETGEVMDESIARRRESIPPPSVSRVMQRMGMTSPADQPREHMPQRELPPLPKAPAQVVEEREEAVVVERRRTGTPQVGVPVVPEVQPAVAGSIERPTELPPPAAAPEPAARPRTKTADPAPRAPVVEVAPAAATAAGRAKRPSTGGFSESASWYDEGERASEEAEQTRARKLISPSSTDLNFYEEPSERRRWPMIAGILGVLVVGGALTFAMTRGGDDKPRAPAQPEVPANVATAPMVDASPSTIIGASVDAGVAIVTTPDAAAPVAVAKKDPPVEHGSTPMEHGPSRTSGGSHEHDRTHGGPTDFDFGVGEDPHRHTSGGTTNPTPPTPPVNPPKGPTGVSGAEGPLDPYNSGGSEPAGDGPEKKAEFFANLGQQQLGSSDTVGAAASFKKAMELDSKNVAAVSGMGEIALRQGLFGDAIVHLKKAARMAPKSSRVFTLLGEAYLNSGQNAVAAENFKKALQLDPDNARAREGYNDASSRVPPPTDD